MRLGTTGAVCPSWAVRGGSWQPVPVGMAEVLLLIKLLWRKSRALFSSRDGPRDTLCFPGEPKLLPSSRGTELRQWAELGLLSAASP